MKKTYTSPMFECEKITYTADFLMTSGDVDMNTNVDFDGTNFWDL